MTTDVKIESCGREHAVFIGTTLLALLSDEQLRQLVRQAGMAQHRVSTERAAESARDAVHMQRVAVAGMPFAPHRDTDFSTIDLELS